MCDSQYFAFYFSWRDCSLFTVRLAEPLPLKHAVELALSHGAAATDTDEQRAYASYHEARNQYIPQLIVGSGLGKSWGFPLSLEGIRAVDIEFEFAVRDLQPSAAGICARGQV